jgi:3-methyladenine DNA glycosylase AlkC
MMKDFFMRKMLEHQMKNVPKEQQEMFIKAVSEHPELFTEIAKKIKTRVDSGEDQMKAAMAVMMDYKDQLQGILESKIS